MSEQAPTPQMGQELPFPRAEHERRIGLAQADLRGHGLAGALLFDPENTFWLTGYQSIGYFTFQCLYLPASGTPTLISRRVNAGLARVTPTLAGFVEIPDTADSVEVLARWLAAEVSAKAVLGLESASWFLSVRDHRHLADTLPNRFEDWNAAVENLRLDKTADELDRIRHAARAAEAGLQAALDVAAPGRTENDLAAAMFHACITAGGEYLGHPPLVVSGERSALCFAMWRRRELREGDVILLESGGCVDRYHAIVARSAVLGRATDLQRRVADAIIGALEAAIAAMGPGVLSQDADAACRSVIEDAGFGERFAHRTAYGVGIGFPPNWSEGKSLALRPGDATVLKPGMTFHIVPTVFHDSFGMCFSETVLVTEDGCEVLTEFPRQLFELGG